MGKSSITHLPIAVHTPPLATFLLVPCLLTMPWMVLNTYGQITTAISQTTGRGDLGTSISQSGNTYNITGGARQGVNLFHSFDRFSVGPGDVANFQNSMVNGILPRTDNILSRVTGTQPSEIFGTLRTTDFGNANLFLLNPHGIVFGPGAALDIGAATQGARGSGSFFASTADYLKMGEGASAPKFYVDVNQTSTFTSSPVAAFGFLGPNAASIAVQGSTLEVPEGRTLALIGGNGTFQLSSGETVPSGVTVTGSVLKAPSGQILLASVDSAGEVETVFDSAGRLMSSNFESFPKLGRVSLSEGTLLDVSTLSDPDSTPLSDLGSGTVRIRGGQFVMDAAVILANTLGTQDGAPIAVSVETSGDLSLHTGIVSITNGSLVVSTSSGPGRAGDVAIVGESVSLANASNIITANFDAGSVGGNIDIRANKSLTLSEGSTLLSTTLGRSNGGDITIVAPESFALSGSDGSGNFSRIKTQSEGLPGSSGNGGSINITAGSLNISDPSSIGTDSSSTANAGHIAMIISGDLSLAGGATISSENGAASGEINIRADRLLMSGQSQFSDTQIMNRNVQGVTSDIIITARELSVTDGARILSSGSTDRGSILITASDSAAFSNGGRAVMQVDIESGAAGERAIDIWAKNTIRLDQGLIQTFTVGSGDAGTITLNAENISLTGSQLTSATTQTGGRGGNVTVTASNQLTISGQFLGTTTTPAGPAGISSRTELNGGQAGNISLQARTLDISNGAHIDSTTSSAARGGNITIETTAALNLHNGATISAGSIGTGNAGTVIIQGTAGPTHSVAIDGTGTGIFTSTANTGTGGNITMAANEVQIPNGGTISASSSGTMAGAGNAGNIAIAVSGDFQSSGGIVRTTAAHGAGGDILITAGQDILLTNNASISASSAGPGNAGSITALAGDDFVMQNSSITTQATQASGGNIKIGAVDQIVLQNSLISASVMGGGGSGGNISIDPTVVILQNSQVLAQAIFGEGGNITITTPLFLADQTSLVSASSQFGLNGTVTIQNPTSNLSGKVSSLPSSMRQTQGLQTGRCAALANSQSSSLTIAGRDTMPAEPGGWLPSPFALAGEDGGPFAQPVAQPTPLFASAHETVSLRRLTPAGFLTQHFAESESTGCRS